MNNVVPGAAAPQETMEEINVPSFVTNGRARSRFTIATKEESKKEGSELEKKIAEFYNDASSREKDIISDLELVLDTIRKYGVPDKIKFSCQMEYDSDGTRKNKIFKIKR